MKNSHLTDDRLIELGLSDTPSATEQLHLGACSACESRRSTTARLFEELEIAAHEDADAVFTAERLARQQTRVMQRIALEPRHGKVIAFPAGHEVPTAIGRTRPTSRWVAAAAVAGLLAGLAAGRLAPETRRALGGGRQVAVTSAPVAAPTGGIRNASATLSDDQLLVEIENAVNRRGGASLHLLDELTPRAWE